MEISEEIVDGEMPPFHYVYPMHMDARLGGRSASVQRMDHIRISQPEATDVAGNKAVILSLRIA